MLVRKIILPDYFIRTGWRQFENPLYSMCTLCKWVTISGKHDKSTASGRYRIENAVSRETIAKLIVKKKKNLICNVGKLFLVEDRPLFGNYENTKCRPGSHLERDRIISLLLYADKNHIDKSITHNGISCSRDKSKSIYIFVRIFFQTWICIFRMRDTVKGILSILWFRYRFDCNCESYH